MATRRQRAEDAAAGAEEYGAKKLDLETLRGLCKVTKQPLSEEDVKTLYAYFDERELWTVAEARDHHEILYLRVKDSMDDPEMAFKKLCQALSSKSKLARHVGTINDRELTQKVAGAIGDKLRASTTALRQVLDVLASVLKQYKAEEKDRNSSAYEKALDALEEAQQLSPDVKAQWVARGELYKATGVLASCACLREFNEKVLETSFDKTLHLPAGAQDLSFGDYTPHLAAKPGADSRLALSKIGDAPGLLEATIENGWFCYCWRAMALLENYYIARCCYYVFGSYVQQIGVEGELGAAYAAIALGTQFLTMNKQELAAFKERVEGEHKRYVPVGILDSFNKFQVFEFVSDKGDTVVCVKKDKGEGSSVAEWRKSSFLGGSQLDPSESVRVVQIDGPTGEHAFAEILIENCSRKLALVEPLPIVCVRSGLNDLASSFHYLSASDPSRSLLDIIRPVRPEVFVCSRTRSCARYPPPTLKQHTSTIETITNLDKIGSGDLVHQKKDRNSQTNSETGARAHTADECSSRAFHFIRAILDGTVGDGGTYNVCQFVAPTPLTEMQEATALVISKPGGAAKAVAYLTPRVGVDHVKKLKAFGRELAKRKNEILALAAKAAAPSGSDSKRRRRS